jgi:predicted nucleic acid-binding protein
LDASAAVRTIIDANPMPASMVDTLDSADTILVPALFKTEVANALWKYVQHGDITAQDAAVRLKHALSYPDHQVDETSDPRVQELTEEALSEACHLNHPVYDLVYVVLARRLSATLVTCDGRLAQVAQSLGVAVIVC